MQNARRSCRGHPRALDDAGGSRLPAVDESQVLQAHSVLQVLAAGIDQALLAVVISGSHLAWISRSQVLSGNSYASTLCCSGMSWCMLRDKMRHCAAMPTLPCHTAPHCQLSHCHMCGTVSHRTRQDPPTSIPRTAFGALPHPMLYQSPRNRQEDAF